MVLKFLRIIITLSLFRISFTDKTITITNEVCNKKYDITEYQTISLEYSKQGFLKDNSSKCVLTIFTTNPEDEICVKTKFDGNYIDKLQAKVECEQTLRLYLNGESDFNKYNGYTCSDFQYRPVCSPKRIINAVYWDTLSYTLSDINVVIYWRNIKETKLLSTPSTTSKVETTRSYNGDIDDSSGQYTVSLGFTLIIVLVVCTCCACCYCCCLKYQKFRQQGLYRVPIPEHRYAQQMRQLNSQPPEPSRPLIEEESNSTDAPSYNSVVQMDRLAALIVNGRQNYSPTLNTQIINHENSSRPNERSPSSVNENLRIPESRVPIPEHRYAQQMRQLNSQPPEPSCPLIEEESNSADAPSYDSVMQRDRLAALVINGRQNNSPTLNTQIINHENSSSPNERRPSSVNENLRIPETPPPDYMAVITYQYPRI